MLTPRIPARRRRRDDWHRSDGGVWLPGAADVPRVAGDPMRGAGMVRRGMGLGFLPAGCCCGEEGCVNACSGDVPSSIQVDVAGVGYGACSAEQCDVLNATYVLSRVGTEFRWYINLWSPLHEIVICSSPYQNILQSLTVAAACDEPGTYYLQCHFAFTSSEYNFIFFRSETQDTPFDCAAFSSLVCDFADIKPDGYPDYICQGGTATVTAL